MTPSGRAATAAPDESSRFVRNLLNPPEDPKGTLRWPLSDQDPTVGNEAIPLGIGPLRAPDRSELPDPQEILQTASPGPEWAGYSTASSYQAETSDPKLPGIIATSDRIGSIVKLLFVVNPY